MYGIMGRRGALGLAAGAAAGLIAHPAKADRPRLRVARIQGVNFLPTYLMQRRGLVEAQAVKLGVPDLAVEWIDFAGGGGATDALLAGAVDVVSTGPGNLLLLWDRTRGGVKGIVSNATLPNVLITRDPRIRSLSDYGPTDRIALPTVLVSTQAILLEMAAEALYGPDQWTRLNPNAVQMGHADAFTALMNPTHEVASHFASPPFIARDLAQVPGAHIVTTGDAILGTPLSTAILWGTTRYAAANPGAVRALRMASEEAAASIRADPRTAARDYRTLSRDPMTEDELASMLTEPGMSFDVRPEGTFRFAEFMARIGNLKTKPAAWTDYFLPSSGNLNGS